MSEKESSEDKSVISGKTSPDYERSSGGGGSGSVRDPDYDDRSGGKQVSLGAFVESDSNEESNESTDHEDVNISELADEILSSNVSDDTTTEVNGVEVPDDFFEENITPDVADEVNIDNAVDFVGIEDAVGESGVQENKMLVGKTEDEERMFIKKDKRQRFAESNTVVKQTFDNVESEELQEIVPEINIDDERNAVVLEDVGGDDSNSVTKWGYNNKDKRDQLEKDDYLNALSAKLLVADTDIGGNIVTSSEGKFHPIDFDFAGKNIQDENERIRDADSGFYEDDGNIVEVIQGRVDMQTGSLDFDVETDEWAERTHEIATSVDVESLEEELDESSAVSDNTKNDVIETINTLQDENFIQELKKQ